MPDWVDLPLLSATVSQRSDAAGNILTGGSIEDASTVIDPRISDFDLHGVLNGAFARGPLDPANNLGAENPLPDWPGPIQVSGGAITTSWPTSAFSLSGRVLRFTAAPGAAGDEAYHEEIVPAGGSYGRLLGNYVRLSNSAATGTLASFSLVIGLQYLDATGAAVGNATETATSLNIGSTFQYCAAHAISGDSPPATATQLRIRIGLRRTGAAADVCTADIADVRNDHALANVLIGEQSTPGTYAAGVINQFAGGLTIGPNGLAGPSIDMEAASQIIYLAGITTLLGLLNLPEQTAPATPSSGYGALYVATNGHLHFKNDAGTDTDLTP